MAAAASNYQSGVKDGYGFAYLYKVEETFAAPQLKAIRHPAVRGRVPMLHVVGLPGAGKTTLARPLAAQLGWPVVGIDDMRAGKPATWEGEADAWVEFYAALSRRGWNDVILETSGMNARLCLLHHVAEPADFHVLKLTCRRAELLRRLRARPAEVGGWVYAAALPDREEFVHTMWGRFELLHAHAVIDTTTLVPQAVLDAAMSHLHDWGWIRHDG